MIMSRSLVMLAFGLLLLLGVGCDSGQPSGGPTGSGTPLSSADPPATMTALSSLASLSTPATAKTAIPALFTAGICGYLKKEDVDTAVGKPTQQNAVPTPNPYAAVCSYSGETEFVILTLFSTSDEPEAALVMQNGIEAAREQQDASFQYVPGVGDAAYIGKGKDTDTGIRTWFMKVKQKSDVFMLKWVTTNADPYAALTELGRKVAANFAAAK